MLSWLGVNAKTTLRNDFTILDWYFWTPPITFQNFHHFFKSNLYFRLKSVILRNLRKVMGGVPKYQSSFKSSIYNNLHYLTTISSKFYYLITILALLNYNIRYKSSIGSLILANTIILFALIVF